MNTLELNGKLYESADSLKARLDIAENTLNRYMKRGLPTPIRVGGRRFFDREMVDFWITNKWQ